MQQWWVWTDIKHCVSEATMTEDRSWLPQRNSWLQSRRNGLQFRHEYVSRIEVDGWYMHVMANDHLTIRFTVIIRVTGKIAVYDYGSRLRDRLRARCFLIKVSAVWSGVQTLHWERTSSTPRTPPGSRNCTRVDVAEACADVSRPKPQHQRPIIDMCAANGFQSIAALNEYAETCDHIEISCRYWIVMCICFISAFLLPLFCCFYCFYYFTYVLWTFFCLK